jgi:hypothetical protein
MVNCQTKFKRNDQDSNCVHVEELGFVFPFTCSPQCSENLKQVLGEIPRFELCRHAKPTDVEIPFTDVWSDEYCEICSKYCKKFNFDCKFIYVVQLLFVVYIFVV